MVISKKLFNYSFRREEKAGDGTGVAALNGEKAKGSSVKVSRRRGKKCHELKNHLGNVLTVVSDVKSGAEGAVVNQQADYYQAVILSAQDYYAFGSLMPGRNYSSPSYRYGFNGQEKDDEWMGSGNALAFEYRIHDARLGRFLSVDPLSQEYPWNSTYAYAENRVIWGIDLEGCEFISRNEARIFVWGGHVQLYLKYADANTQNYILVNGIRIEYTPFAYDPASNRILYGYIVRGGTNRKDSYGLDAEEGRVRSIQEHDVAMNRQSGMVGRNYFDAAKVLIDMANEINASLDLKAVVDQQTYYEKAVTIVNFGLCKGLIPDDLKSTTYLSGIVQWIINGETGFEKMPEIHMKLMTVAVDLFYNHQEEALLSTDCEYPMEYVEFNSIENTSSSGSNEENVTRSDATSVDIKGDIQLGTRPKVVPTPIITTITPPR